MLEIRLLGQFSLQLDGHTIEMPARPAQSLLAYLLLSPVPHRRERLAGLLWPDSSETNARRNLRQALWQIRRALGDRADEFILVDEITLAFNPACDSWLDVAGIAQPTEETATADELMAEVAAYVGELLPGFYDEWVQLERERIQAQFERKLTLLLERLVGARRWPEVLHWGERWIALGYTPEPAYRALMTAHAGLGDQASVADVYRRCVEALERDLGVEPSAQTRILYEQLRSGAQTPAPVATPPSELPTHNLPVHLTSFIGREKEIADMRRLLAPAAPGYSGSREHGVRLLTLTGPGGTGKTRLALQAATHLHDAFPDGIWLVELAMISDPGLVPQTLAALLGVREEPTYPITRTLTTYLRTKTLLLIFDNCEHIVDAAATFVELLLRSCPTLRILVTSRETLGLMGEHVFRVPSLQLPDVGQTLPLHDLAQCEAIRLFVDRATSVNAAFAMTATNAAAVTQICRQLDGVPLAIELAAARVRTMTIEQIAARLDDRFRLLTGGSRTALPRQQTLRAMMDWSWDLLSEAECALLRRLAVFVGGWTLEAAEVVCGEAAAFKGIQDDPPARDALQHPQAAFGRVKAEDVLELLTHLVEKSLVVVEEQAGAARYYLLETIRQYAREKLFEAGEAQVIRTHHLAFYLTVVQEAEPHLRAAHQLLWLARLDLEHDNLRAALNWANSSGDHETGLLLAGSLARFWYLRGYWKEGREWLRSLLAESAPPLPFPAAYARARAKALAGAGWLADADGSEIPLYRESLALCRQVGDQWGEAYALRGLIIISSNLTDLAHAEAHVQASLALFRRLEDEWGVGLSFFSLGWIAMSRDKIDDAHREWEAALASFRAVGDRWGISVALGALGYLARLRGHYPQAAQLTNESLALFRELGDKAGVSYSLIRLGNLAWRRGDYTEATALIQESLNIQRERNNQEGIIAALQSLALVACFQSRFEAATALLRESGQLAQPRAIPIEIGDNLSIQARVYYTNNELTQAAALFEQSLTIFQAENETEGIAFGCYGLGLIALQQGDYGPAATHLEASLRLWQLRGHKQNIAAVFTALGQLALAQKEQGRATRQLRAALTLYQEMVDKQGAAAALEGASTCVAAPIGAQLLGAAHALRQLIGAPVAPVDAHRYAQAVAGVRNQLGASSFVAAWTVGEALSYEQAILLALANCA